MKTRLIAVIVPAVAAMAFAAPAVAATTLGSTTSESVSENWAGYEATPTDGSDFSAASGSWIQPTVDCSESGTSYSAFWVGLGGGSQNSTALEQEGTQADCTADGQATYYAWYELVPSAPVKIAMAIQPGDKIWARTAVNGDQVTIEVDNKTTGAKFAKTLTMTAATPDTSTAEWVAEAPSECAGGASGQCQPLQLADFSKVNFTGALATSDGQTKSVSGWDAQAIALSPSAESNYGYGNGYGGGFGSAYGGSSTADDNAEGAAPSSLSSDGTSFSVSYGADASAGDSGYGESGYGTSGYGTSGYGTSGYGDSGYGASGYGTQGYSYDPAGNSGGYGYSDGYAGSYGYAGGYGFTNPYSYGYGAIYSY